MLFAVTASARQAPDHVHGVHFEDGKMYYHGIVQSKQAMMLLHSLSSHRGNPSKFADLVSSGKNQTTVCDIIAPRLGNVEVDAKTYGGPIGALMCLEKTLNLMPDEIGKMDQYKFARNLLNDCTMRLNAYGYVAYTQDAAYEYIVGKYLSHYLPELYGWVHEFEMAEMDKPGTEAYIKLQQKFSSFHKFLYYFRAQLLLSRFDEFEESVPHTEHAGEMQEIHAMDFHIEIDQLKSPVVCHVDDEYINSVYMEIKSLIKQTLHAQRDYNIAYEKYQHHRMVMCRTVGEDRDQAMVKTAKAMHELLKAQENLYNNFMIAKKYEKVLEGCCTYLLRTQLNYEKVREMKLLNSLTPDLTKEEEKKAANMKNMCKFFETVHVFSENANLSAFLIGHHQLRKDLLVSYNSVKKSYNSVKKLNSDIKSGVVVCPETSDYALLDESILDIQQLDAKHLSLVKHSSQFLETVHKMLAELKPLEKLSVTVPPGMLHDHPYGRAEYATNRGVAPNSNQLPAVAILVQ